MKFAGFRRYDGTVGVRNYIAILPTTGCASEVALRIAEEVNGAVPLLHHQGCCQLKPDLEQVTRVLIGLGRNPNVASVLVVSLGCESISPQEVVEGIAESQKPVEMISIQAEGGFTATVKKGIKIVSSMASEARKLKREPCSLADLTVGVKCGASDATSGLVSNPAVGSAVDKIVDAGGTVIFGETTEVIGAEHILAKRAINELTAKKIFEAVERMESKAKKVGVDMRGSQPTAGNIKGGLTTIEEKSLGAISKSGSRLIQGVLEYGEAPRGKGLYFMDSPGMELVYMTGVAACGTQVILFSTGLGAPQGFPIVPVIKISGNEKTCRHLSEHIDIDLSTVLRGEESLDEGGERILEAICRVASGEVTKAEAIGYDKTVDIYVLNSFV